MSEYSVYHICREADIGNFSVGYIGITQNTTERWYNHKIGWSGSQLVNRAYKKYDDIVESVVLTGSKELCLYTEMQLRPDKRIGWNLTEGGGLPPNLSGKIMSQEQKDKIGKSNSGQANFKWKGYWVIDGVKYVSMNEASRKLGCAKRTVRNRALSDDFPSWTFEESPNPTFRRDNNE